MKLKRVTREMVVVTTNVEQEETTLVGNAMASGDPRVDKSVESWILEELAKGNYWAWCSVSVKVQYKHYEGVDHLGCCSYKDEDDFKTNGDYYYPDMIERALDELNNAIARDFEVLKELIEIPAQEPPPRSWEGAT